MKPNNKQIAELTKYMDGTLSSIRSFNTNVAFYEDLIRRGKDKLPMLLKEALRIENGLPVWQEQLRINEISLAAHREWYSKEAVKLDLLKQKEKLLESLSKLDANEH